MNIYAVIPTHDRKEITSVNIRLLLKQGIKVVLIVSSEHERRYYSQFPIELLVRPNHPLGKKWQDGVDYAKNLNPSHIIITGSDDILCKDFAQRYCTDYHFVSFKAFFIYKQPKLHLLNYVINQGIGGGRVYHRDVLNEIDWKLFDTTRDRLLDDFGNKQTLNFYNSIEVRRPEVLAVKGNWPHLNGFDPNHPNVKLMKTFDGDEAKQMMKEKFDYDS